MPPPRRIHSCLRKTIFQFTPPFCWWQASDGSLRKLAIANIPTIASLPFQLTTSQGGRPMPLSPLCVVLYFNSRPREEVDSLISSLLLRYISISTHDLTRRSTRKQTIYNNLERIFQLTTSRGGRPAACYCSWYSSYISTHDLTKRSTLVFFRLLMLGIYFNSRPHEEVDACDQSQLHQFGYFNSRSHEEVDRCI